MKRLAMERKEIKNEEENTKEQLAGISLEDSTNFSSNNTCWIFCVLTTDKVYVFDSGNFNGPLAIMQNYHLTTLTDACWEKEGKRLLVCSSDGFVSSFVFDWSGMYVPVNNKNDGNIIENVNESIYERCESMVENASSGYINSNLESDVDVDTNAEKLPLKIVMFLLLLKKNELFQC